MGSLETMTNALDNPVKGNFFFTENFTNRIKDMREKFFKGTQQQDKQVDKILLSIPGIKAKRGAFKSPYSVLIDMLAKPMIQVQNKKGQDESLTRDQALRIYALWQNPVQKNKLENGGTENDGTFYNQKTIDQIIKQLDPELIQFADKIMAYLSTDYYDSINEVYMQTNNANLPRIENYFPTRTVSDAFKVEQLKKGEDFGQIFQAIAPALHERTDTKGAVAIFEGSGSNVTPIGFTSTLSTHFAEMERFKAYAEGVKTMRDIIRMKSVNSLLEATGMKSMIKFRIMAEVNPSFLNANKGKQMFSRTFSNFTSWVLGFKLWQVPKQAASFVTSFRDYNSGLVKKDIDPLGITRSAADLLMYSIDLLSTVANLSTDLLSDKQRQSLSKALNMNIPEGPIHQAYRVSATFRDRVKSAYSGDVWGLESGSVIKKKTGGVQPRSMIKLKEVYVKTKIAGNSFTMLGDVLGVMGYMINYRANIRNGMSEAEALRQFNKYESTQQTRGTVEKNKLQLTGADYTRLFTMFASTIFLQQNQIAQSSTNIVKALSIGKVPRKEDIRGFYLNLGLANVSFIFMQQIFKYAFGDDEEKEQVLTKMWEVMFGLNSIAELPIMGPALMEVYDYFLAENKKPFWKRRSMATNPVNEIILNALKNYEKEGSFYSIRELAEQLIGINTDPMVGFYNKVIHPSTFFKMDVDFFDMIGIPKTARPQSLNKTAKEIKSEEELTDIL